MLKENWRFISRIERLGDTFIIILMFFLAYHGRHSLFFWDQLLGLRLPFEGPQLAPLRDYFIVLLLGLVSYTLTLNILGAYTSMRLSNVTQLVRISFVSSIVVFVVLAASLFVLKIPLSRSFIGLFCVLAALCLALERFLVLDFLRYWRQRGMNFRNVIICGMGEQAIRLAREITSHPELGVRIRAFAYLGDSTVLPAGRVVEFRKSFKKRTRLRAARVIIGLVGLETALERYSIDEVIFTDVVDVMSRVEAVVNICSEQGIETTIAADLFSLGIVKSGMSYFGGMPLIHFQTPPGDRWELSAKRIFDIIISASLLVFLAPLFLLLAIIILCLMGRPVFFSQKRMGLNGRLFDLYKFRSMNVGAELEQPALTEHNEMSGPAFKMRNDPRVTPFGSFIRRFSLDELPQLWNVFRGDMSLVGPRPPLPGEVSLYERKERRRLSMRPGMTCIWQISGRNDIQDFEDWVRLDLDYIDNWSLSNDFLILIKTIPVVLSGTGA